LTSAELDAKCLDNARFGGWGGERSADWLTLVEGIFGAPTLDTMEVFRG